MEENLTVIIKMSRSLEESANKIKELRSQLDYTGDFISMFDNDLRQLETLVNNQISYIITIDDRLQEIERALGINNLKS